MMVFGETGISKSIAVENLTFGVAGGTNWIGLDIPKAHRVLYLQAEIGDDQFWERTVSMDSHYRLNGTPAAQNLWLERQLDLKLNTPQGLHKFRGSLDTAKPEIVVIDPLYKFMTGTDTDQDSLKALFDRLDRIVVVERGAALVLVHHSRKAPQYGGSQFNFGKAEARGHTTITDWMDTVIQLTMKKDQHIFTFEKMRNGPMIDPIVQELNEKTLVFGAPATGIEDELRKLNGQNAIRLNVLKTNVANRTGASERTVQRRLDALVRRGELKTKIDPTDSRYRIIYR